MTARVGLIFLLFGLFGDTVAEQGRKGNAQFRDGEYAAADSLYREALSTLDDSTGTVYSGLQNNLGLALQRQSKYAPAQEAFEEAIRSAASDAGRVRSLFNGANAAAALGERKQALDYYRRVLLLDPTHEAARFNYEYLRRNTGGPSGGQSANVDPSPYAKKLKQKAEALVAETRYAAAAALMKDGLQRDSTVAAYQDFITRIEEVAQISRSEP